jgi:hypothetical protein
MATWILGGLVLGLICGTFLAQELLIVRQGATIRRQQEALAKRQLPKQWTEDGFV